MVAKGFNEHGEPVRLVGTGMMARCCQHETDHLDGVLFLDRLDPTARKDAMRQIRAAPWYNADAPPTVKVSPHAGGLLRLGGDRAPRLRRYARGGAALAGGDRRVRRTSWSPW